MSGGISIWIGDNGRSVFCVTAILHSDSLVMEAKSRSWYHTSMIHLHEGWWLRHHTSVIRLLVVWCLRYHTSMIRLAFYLSPNHCQTSMTSSESRQQQPRSNDQSPDIKQMIKDAVEEALEQQRRMILNESVSIKSVVNRRSKWVWCNHDPNDQYHQLLKEHRRLF